MAEYKIITHYFEVTLGGGAILKALRQQVEDRSVSCVDLSTLYKQTMGWVKFYAMRVRQGFGVEDANDFARYVMNSGLTNIMTANPPENERQAELFPYDGNALWSAANKLRLDCCEYYQGRTRDSEGTPAGVTKSDLELIHQKLELLLTRKRKPKRIAVESLSVVPQSQSVQSISAAVQASNLLPAADNTALRTENAPQHISP